MKSLLLFSIVAFYSITADSQTVAELSKTQKINKDGIELIIFEGKPLTGFVTENYPNGKPKSWITLTDGMANGLWQEWYENGRLKYNAFWLAGKGHGLWEYYHENGVLRQEEYYNRDVPIGIFREFYENGQLKSKTNWLNGAKQGSWTYFNEAGVLLKTEVYEANKLISATGK
jgi:antitoxin component YwqK of YwqJK toxin-antitoxin module